MGIFAVCKPTLLQTFLEIDRTEYAANSGFGASMLVLMKKKVFAHTTPFIDYLK